MESAPGRVEVFSACRRAAWRLDTGLALVSRVLHVPSCARGHKRFLGAMRASPITSTAGSGGLARRSKHTFAVDGVAKADGCATDRHMRACVNEHTAAAKRPARASCPPGGHRRCDRATEPHRARVSGLTHNMPRESRTPVRTAVRVNPWGRGNGPRGGPTCASENVDRARGPTDS